MTSSNAKDLSQVNPFSDPTSELETYYKALINVTSDPIFLKDENSRLLLVNDALCKMFGMARQEIIGKTLFEKVTPSESEHYLSIDKLVLNEGKEITCQETLSVEGGQTKTILTKKNRFVDANGNRFLVGVLHDITKPKQTELREKARSHVLELITRGEPLSVILKAIVKAVEQDNPNMLCSILILDGTGQHLLSGTAASLPGFFNDAIHGIEIGFGVGSCGTAAFINERVIVEDISTHPYWAPYKALANKAGLAACWSEPIRSSKGKVLGTFAIYHQHKNLPTEADLTIIEQTASLASIAIEKKQTEEKLKRAASVFTHANEGIIITDASGAILEVNHTFSHITGYSQEEVLGKNPKILQSGQHSAQFYIDMWDCIKDKGNWRGEIWNRRKNGEIYPETLTISEVKDSDGMVQHYVSLSTDITALKANQKKLEHIAHYDLLTNLPNRVLLADRLKQAMKQCQRHNKSLAVAFMDLDGFKAINDNYGHNVGDEFLVTVSQSMQDALREGDTLARIGGDEFVAVMVDLDKFEDCELVLNRLLEAAAAPVKRVGSVLQVSASIGVTLYPQDGADAELLIRHADQAMYVAKQAGKNRYHLFDTVQDDAINLQHQSIDTIRCAIQNNEFVLYYQPKINMRTGAVVGVEALIRWQHPSQGVISPLEFLPIIEGQTVSLDLGHWIIDTALAQLNEWQSSGIDLPVSVNISAYQLQQSDFTETLVALLSSYPEIAPNLLELEILETSALHDTKQVSATMQACHKLGVRFALDDFGTGYSSLTYLKSLPAHMIKIDQSFVQDMLKDADDLAIVKGVLGLANAFQCKVIAEGVESIAHGGKLVQLGCELGQGNAISSPMPATDIPLWLSNWQTNKAWRL